MVEYAKIKGHNIQFDKINILNEKAQIGKQMYKEPIEIEKFPDNFNWKDGWKICKTWISIIHLFKKKENNKLKNSSK